MHKTINDALFDKTDICKHIHVPATFGDEDWCWSVLYAYISLAVKPNQHLM